MNYTWEYLIRAELSGVPSERIQFKPAKYFSPYMELSTAILNQKEVITDGPTEINPFYRYDKIFNPLFQPDLTEYVEARGCIMDLVIHEAFHTEKYMGMTRLGFYKRFLTTDILNGCFGNQCAKTFAGLTQDEQEVIALQLLNLYRNGSSVNLWKEVIVYFYKSSFIYQYHNNVILLYLGKKEEKVDKELLNLIRTLFLPFEYQVEIYFENHFGIIDVDETMVLDLVELY